MQRHEVYAAAEAASRAQIAAVAPAESGDAPEPAAADGAIAANAATLPPAPLVLITAKPKRKFVPIDLAVMAPYQPAASGFALKPANGISQRYVPLR